jgi:hypothetical protein
MDKPSVYPDFAVNTDGTDNDVVNSESGENNVEEPTAPKKLLGWDYKEKPPRGHMNWLHRITTQWVRWFDDYITNTIDNEIAQLQTDVTTLQNNDAIFISSTISSQNFVINLPSGFTKDNCIILSACLYASAQGVTPMPYYGSATDWAMVNIALSGGVFKIMIDMGADTLTKFSGGNVYGVLRKVH